MSHSANGKKVNSFLSMLATSLRIDNNHNNGHNVPSMLILK